jgi:hypothetical protein
MMNKQCPICGDPIEHLALSRADSKTEICSRCGMDEAMMCCKMQQQGMSREEIRVALRKNLKGDQDTNG